jgi:hypothetical protein
MPPRARRSSTGSRRLTAKQRNALPRSAFLDPTHRRFPVPTAGQARAAGISETQRLGILRSALSRAGQSQPRRQPRGRRGRMVAVRTVTPTAARRKVRARAGGKIASVKPSRAGRARGRRRRRGGSRRRR